MTTLIATLGGLTFTSDASTIYAIQKIDGWFDGAPVKTSPDERANSDGSFGVSRFLRAARPIKIFGFVNGSGDDSYTFGAYQTLSSILASGVPATLTITDPTGVKSAVVMVTSSTLDPIFGGYANFALSLLAFDPLKYGPTATQSTGLPTSGGGLEYPLESPIGALSYGALGGLGRVTVSNAGSADAWPSFVVSGQLDAGFYIQALETGQVLRYDRVVPAGTTVTLNSRTGDVLIDGVSDASTYLTRSEWFSIPAGGARTIQFNAVGGSSGSPTMQVTNSDAYL